MEADESRLEAKLRGATVIDLDAAREARNRDTSMPFVDGVKKAVAMNWVFIVAFLILFAAFRRYAR